MIKTRAMLYEDRTFFLPPFRISAWISSCFSPSISFFSLAFSTRSFFSSRRDACKTRVDTILKTAGFNNQHSSFSKGFVFRESWLEVTLKNHLMQNPSAMGKDSFHYTSCSKPHPTWPWTLPGSGIHSFSGQPVPLPHHPHNKEFLPST